MAGSAKPKASSSTSTKKRAAAPAKAGSSRSKAAVRSTDHPSVPFYRKAPHESAEGPSVEHLLELLGLESTRPLTTDEIRPLLKADDDTLMLIGDNILELFKRDAARLGIGQLTPEILESLYQRVLYLTPRAPTAAMVATIVAHQKAVAVSDFLDALLRIRRRVGALAEDDPDLEARWERVMGYFATRFPGRGVVGGAAAADATGAVEPAASEASAASLPDAPAAAEAPAAGTSTAAAPAKKKAAKSVA